MSTTPSSESTPTPAPAPGTAGKPEASADHHGHVSLEEIKEKTASKLKHWTRIGYIAVTVVVCLAILETASFPSPPTGWFVFSLLGMILIMAMLVALLLPRVRQILGRVVIYVTLAVVAVSLSMTLGHTTKKMRFSANANNYEQVVTTLGPPPAQVPLGPDGQPVKWNGHCPATIGKHEIAGCVLVPDGYVFYLRKTGISEFAGYAYFAGQAPKQALPQLLLGEGSDFDFTPAFVQVKDHWYAFRYNTW